MVGEKKTYPLEREFSIFLEFPVALFKRLEFWMKILKKLLSLLRVLGSLVLYIEPITSVDGCSIVLDVHTLVYC